MRSAKDDSTVRPILLTLYQATDVTVQNIKMINGPEWINFVRITDSRRPAFRPFILNAVQYLGQRREEHHLQEYHHLRRVDLVKRREEYGRLGYLPQRQRHHR